VLFCISKSDVSAQKEGGRLAFGINGGLVKYWGEFQDKQFWWGGDVFLSYDIVPFLSLQASTGLSQIRWKLTQDVLDKYPDYFKNGGTKLPVINQDNYYGTGTKVEEKNSTRINNYDVYLAFNFFSSQTFIPSIFGGIGLMNFEPRNLYQNSPLPNNNDGVYKKSKMVIPFGVSFEYYLTDNLVINGKGTYRLTGTPYLDDFDGGHGNDGFLTFGMGLSFYIFGNIDYDEDGLTNAEEKALGTNPRNPDTDGDGLLDGEEVKRYKTNPLEFDTDKDGLSDGEEVKKYGTDPLKFDTDGDGLSDGDEIARKTDPLNPDTDGDGLLDGDEVLRYKTDPLNKDTDGDGLSDGDEVKKYMTDPLKKDTDGDGLSDGDEIKKYKTDPLKADTDGDGLSDGDEVLQFKTDPLKKDTDGDGLFDGEEVLKYKTDPLNPDTDKDGLTDGDEVNKYFTNPLLKDTDGDGLSDGDEVNKYKTNPLKADTDGDGLSDSDEVIKYKTDPLKADTDGDGLSDGDEINKYKTDPLNPDTDADGLSDGDEINKYKTDPLNPDTDGDTIIDGKDDCPLLPGVPSTIKGRNGCPETPKIGTKVDFPDINFIVNTDNFDFTNEGTINNLSKLLAYVNQCEKINVNLEGHASAEGNSKRNQQLSELRALKVQGWLIQQGTRANKIVKVTGYGSSLQKIKEPTGIALKKMPKAELEKIRKQNRRITVEIIKGCD
jgi:outer membrane protein OmpA-like peptidoglycan-associated protein